MATVYRAENTAEDGVVAAVKMLHPHLASDASLRRRLRVEAEALSRLHHDNIVQLYDFVDLRDRCAIVTELVHGRTLRQVMAEHVDAPMAPLMAVQLMTQVLEAVSHAHAEGCLHRDLKPGNIMVTANNQVKVLDFGIASLIDSDRLTTTGVTVGTPVYMAPEQLNSMDDLDARADIYSMGVTFWELLSGYGSRPIGVKEWRLSLRDVDGLLKKGVPAALVEVVESMVREHRADRIPSCDEVLKALKWARDEGVTASNYAASRPQVPYGSITADTVAPSGPWGLGGGAADDANDPGAMSGSVTVAFRVLQTTNIQARLTTFVGREEELDRLAGLFHGRSRVVTLVGAAGAGKTRLAQRFGVEAVEQFPGGVWFCDLTLARDLAGLCAVVGAVLQVPLTSRDPVARLGDALQGRGKVLLILDNFEQLDSESALAVAQWSRTATQARLLLTSRSKLQLEGEQLLPLAPLPVVAQQKVPLKTLAANPAIQLFVDRAQSVCPDFALERKNAADVRAIVEELDGLPLAIELAAARVRLIPPKTIRERLSSRFQLLQSSSRGVKPQQATLLGAIRWSWDLLNPWEQASLAQCSVFEGGFGLEAAEQVLDLSPWPDAPWAMDALQHLVDHSLLHVQAPDRHSGEPRYRLLLSIQSFASDQLRGVEDPEETQDGLAVMVRPSDIEQRHGVYYAALGAPSFLDRLDEVGGTERRHSLRLELDNLLVAAERAVGRGDSGTAESAARAILQEIRMAGPFDAGLRLATRVLALDGVADSSKVRLLIDRAALRAGLGDLERADADLARALKLCKATGDPLWEGIVSLNQAGRSKARGDGPVARRRYQEAIGIFRDVGHRRLEGNGLGGLAGMLRKRGEMEEARAMYRQALEIHRDVGDRRAEAVHLGELGLLELSLGERGFARASMERSLAIFRSIGDRRSEGIVINNLALFHREEGRLEDARTLMELALTLQRELGNVREQAVLLGNLGDLAIEQGELAEAQMRLTEAVGLARELEYQVAIGAFLGSLGTVAARLGDVRLAREHLDAGEGMLRTVGDLLELAKLLCRKAVFALSQEQKDVATDAVNEARQLAVTLGVSGESELAQRLDELATKL